MLSLTTPQSLALISRFRANHYSLERGSAYTLASLLAQLGFARSTNLTSGFENRKRSRKRSRVVLTPHQRRGQGRESEAVPDSKAPTPSALQSTLPWVAGQLR